MTDDPQTPSEPEDKPLSASEIRKVAANAVHDFADLLERRAKELGGIGLTDVHIRAYAKKFGADILEGRLSYDQNEESDRVPAGQPMWDYRRRFPFDRIVVETFMPLLDVEDKTGQVVEKKRLSRRCLVGFLQSVPEMMGRALYDQSQRKMEQLAKERIAPANKMVMWDKVLEDHRTERVLHIALVVIAEWFTPFDEKLDWLITQIIAGAQMETELDPSQQSFRFTREDACLLLRGLFGPFLEKVEQDQTAFADKYSEDVLRDVMRFWDTLCAEPGDNNPFHEEPESEA